ncbi:SixA phosphatase family protein [Lacinutrix iliipiscaria]|uniref:SixA phosphatase family protein n=1 Tax=Lacinutrix iliipiscaria TaxID=1230532 RepID=A0ABW5WP86_9FLAO
MKNLILIRHAKSSWEHNVIDFLRPLKARGLKDSHLVSKHLILQNIKPDLILSSDAKRAKMTAEIFIDSMSFYDIDFQLHNDLYDFSGSNLLKTIHNCDNKVKSLMIFGHNHAITSFVNTFGSKYIENVPTCGVVFIRFKSEDWKNLIHGETVFTIFPKGLRS